MRESTTKTDRRQSTKIECDERLDMKANTKGLSLCLEREKVKVKLIKQVTI
jgi:hypothetical protein